MNKFNWKVKSSINLRIKLKKWKREWKKEMPRVLIMNKIKVWMSRRLRKLVKSLLYSRSFWLLRHRNIEIAKATWKVKRRGLNMRKLPKLYTMKNKFWWRIGNKLIWNPKYQKWKTKYLWSYKNKLKNKCLKVK